MKITDLIVEKQNVDEVSLAQVGQAIGKGATATGKAIGATASGAVQTGKNFWQGLKTGWQAGKQAVANTGTNATSTVGTTSEPATAGSKATPMAAPASGSDAPSGGTSPAPSGGATTPAASAAPAASPTGPTTSSTTAAAPASASTTNVDDIIAQIGTLSPTQKATLKTELDKVGIKATPVPTPPTTKPKKPRAKKPKPFVPGASTGAGDIGIMENKFYSKFLDQKI